MAPKQVRTKDLKKQRWAGIVAAVLALAMVVSVAGIYLGRAAGNDSPILSDQPAEPQPEDYLNYYEAEVERLETYLDEHEPSEAVLLELAENYRYLIFIRQAFFDDQEAIQEYRTRLTSLYQTLVDLAPSNPEHRLELVRLYAEKQEDERLIEKEIAELQELLREEPDPLVQLSLIGLLSAVGEEELFREELELLAEYLETRIADRSADNEERFYYAVLLGEYLDDPSAAKEILEQVLDQGSEDTWIYQEALNYLAYLEANEKEDIIFE